MKFLIEKIEKSNVTDSDLFDLLSLVYIDGGFVTEERANVIFEPSVVRKRGQLFIAKEISTGVLAGTVIVVPEDSEASVLTKQGECEMHLLAVKSDFRGDGLGRLLVNSAIKFATDNSYTKMILWTKRAC